MELRTRQRVLISALGDFVGHEVRLNAFVDRIRDQKTVQFVILRDHSGLVQATMGKNTANEAKNRVISGLTRESIVSMTGRVAKEPRVRLRGLELLITDIDVVAPAPEVLPLDLTDRTASSIEHRLNWRFLDLRNPRNYLIYKVQTTLEEAMREYWQGNGFVQIYSPKLMGTASESGSDVFELDYFDRKAYLAQSPQFYKQMAMAAGFDRVFEIGPAFRAEPSFTARHNTEFVSVDMEMSWIESHEDIMAFEETWLQHVLGRVAERHGTEISDSYGVEVRIPTVPFPRISMTDARAIAESAGVPLPPGELGRAGEQVVAEHVRKAYGHEFLFISEYPVDVRPFYHMRCKDDPTSTKSYDLLWNGLEITTGAQREHRYDVLVAQSLEKGLSPDSIEDYLGFFKFGCPPHGGFGFGLDRLTMTLLSLQNIRDVAFVARDPGRLRP